MESNSNNITMNDISDAEIQQKMQEMFGEAVDEVDKAGFIRGYKQFATIPSAATGNVEKANTRVVKDVFHLMDMIKPYKKHSLYKSFTRKFSESLFTIDEDDKSKIIEAFAKAKAADHQFPHDWESKMKYYRGWLWKRVRRKVSPPHVFLPLLVSLFLSFGPLKCMKSGRSLFDRKSWEQAASVLKIVQLGHASDPPDVQLYYRTGKKDKYGLTLYRCIRGTNSLEGGVHQNLIRKFGSFGAGPELANAMLTEYRLRHNIDVGSHIDQMKRCLQACDQLENDLMVQVNALHYLGSEEVFGICPLPDNEMDSLGIEKMQTSTELTTCTNDDSTVPKLEDTALLRIGTTSRSSSSRYIFVAKSQGTRYAVLSVHTLKEKLEFNRILEADFKSPNTVLNFNNFARSFNSKADGLKIFYKTPDHLEKYYRQYLTQAASKSTSQRFQAVFKKVRDEIVQVNQPTSLLNAVSPTIPVLGGSAAILSSVNVNSDVPVIQQITSTPPLLAEAWLKFIQFQQQQQQQQQNQPQHQEQQQLPIPRMAHSPSPVIRRQPLTASGIYRPHHPYYVNTRIIIPRTTRTCRGCGRKPEECKGASKRSRCTQPKCLKCGRSAECNGIWDRTKCNY
ncbi:hypothetical protein [Parasitella parasitica]|uniref:Uncharacterized protein n=1 Tax=Parasitella parasitica TaxID=35722 RepID=A0A0B7N3M9_9FUNG|nr:hypothetical protein [Parasitella parasitica]